MMVMATTTTTTLMPTMTPRMEGTMAEVIPARSGKPFRGTGC
jgi:hypothetical protein